MKLLPLTTRVVLAFACPGLCRGAELSGQAYVDALRRFANRVLADGRDTYGIQKTPLFVDGLHSETLRPATWKNRGQTFLPL